MYRNLTIRKKVLSFTSSLPKAFLLQKLGPKSFLFVNWLWNVGLGTGLYYLLNPEFALQNPWAPLWGSVSLGALLALSYIFAPWLSAILGLFIAILNITYLHVVWLWGTQGLITRFHALLEANPTEQRDYFTFYVLRSHSTVWLGLYFLFSFLLVVLSMIYHNRLRLADSSLRRRVLFIGLVVIAITVFIYPTAVHYPCCFTLVLFKQAKHDLALLEQRHTWLQNHPVSPNTTDVTCTPFYTKIVVVIGESANRDWMSVYGYSSPTTPFLERLLSASTRGDGLAIRAIGPGNLTRVSLPLILSEASVQDNDKFYQTHSIVSLLRTCGYQTFWLSNQELMGSYTMNAYSIGEEADILRFTVSLVENYYHRSPYDEDVLRLLPQQAIDPDRKQAFFFHLIGSHVDYRKRYPSEYAFVPSPENLEQAYVNTIYYRYCLSKDFGSVSSLSRRSAFRLLSRPW